MADSLDAILAETDDSKLIDRMFGWITDRHGNDFDASVLAPEERAVILPYHAMGIIGNGGFNYLFEGDFPGDPYFRRTAKAFQRIGCEAAYQAFCKALALFPDSRPPRDIGKRLRIYRQGTGEKRHEIDVQFWNADDEITQKIAQYVRAHRQTFAALAGTRPRRPAPKREKQDRRGARWEFDVAELPHWGRVALLTRWARYLLPAFKVNWPDAAPERTAAVRCAIELAEQSAARGRPVEGLDRAVRGAIMTAGGASFSVYGIESAEALPRDGNAAVAASFVAKTAEKAAEAAHSSPEQALEEVLFGCNFAFNIEGKEAARAYRRIKKDFANLLRVARRGRWTDRTPVPQAAFDLLADDDEPSRPWWKFW